MECIWDYETEHNGNVSEKDLFNGELKNITICEKHYKQHMNIMILQYNDFDIEKLLEMTGEQLQAEVDTLVANGVDISEVKF